MPDRPWMYRSLVIAADPGPGVRRQRADAGCCRCV